MQLSSCFQERADIKDAIDLLCPISPIYISVDENRLEINNT